MKKRDVWWAGALIVMCSALLFARGCHADPLTPAQYVAEVAYDAELIVDYHQTNNIVPFCYNKVNCTMREYNPLLGKEPEPARIRNYFVAGLVGHGVVTYVLPSKYRGMWQEGTLVIETVMIGNNKRLGLGFKF